MQYEKLDFYTLEKINIIDCLFCFSSQKYQEEVWLANTDKDYCDSFCESCHMFFDDFCVEDSDFLLKVGFSEKQMIAVEAIAVEVREIVDSHGYYEDDADFLEECDWIETRKRIQKILLDSQLLMDKDFLEHSRTFKDFG